jgi:hypothetical protein
MRLLPALTVASLALAALGDASPAVIPLTLPSGTVLQVEVMVKDEDRAMGLMFRPSLPRTAACCHLRAARLPRHLDEELQVPDRHRLARRGAQGGARRRVGAALQGRAVPGLQPLRRAAYVVELNAGVAAARRPCSARRFGFVLNAYRRPRASEIRGRAQTSGGGRPMPAHSSRAGP